MINKLFMYKILIEKDVFLTFPNVKIALRIYLIIKVTNCSSKHSFSRLKIIKNNLRTSMHTDRLNFLKTSFRVRVVSTKRAIPRIILMRLSQTSWGTY